MPYNLSSPTGIVEPCDLADLPGWYDRELSQVPTEAEREVLSVVGRELTSFVRWPARALLLWDGADRIPEPGKRQKYFRYPEKIKSLAKSAAVRLDTRPNGPAIASFQLAGGDRPGRFGSSNSWSIHHLYSGKFPYREGVETTHAAKHGKHFTQSAGLVAAHPVADALVDEFPFFTWLLRAEAFRRYGYDPDSAFSDEQDAFGFVGGRQCEVFQTAA